jgi:hypothetical protein
MDTMSTCLVIRYEGWKVFSKCEIRSVLISQLSKHHGRLLQRTDLCKLDLLVKDQTDGVIDEITLSGQ